MAALSSVRLKERLGLHAFSSPRMTWLASTSWWTSFAFAGEALSSR